MLKKNLLLLFILIFTVSVFCGGLTCLAEDYPTREFLINGDMEWSGTSYSIWEGYDYKISTDITHNDSGKALVLNPSYTTAGSNTDVTLVQYIYDLIAGQEYTVSFYLRREANFTTTGAGINIKFLNAAGEFLSYPKVSFDKDCPENIGEWELFTHTVVAPANASIALISMYSNGIGDMYFDDLSIVGPCTAESKAENDYYYERMQEGYAKSQYFYTESINKANDVQLSGSNYLQYSGFETSSLYPYWHYPTNRGFTVSRDTNNKKNGNASLSIQVPSNSTPSATPYATQSLTPPNGETTFVAGAQYIISGWVKTVNAPVSGGAFCELKMSYANPYDEENYFAGGQEGPIINTNGEWQEYKYVFTMPENIKSAVLYLRCTKSTGMTVYFDDMVFGRASVSNPISLSTKHTFYYADEGNITANVKFNTGVVQIESGSNIRYTLLDKNENNVVDPYEVSAAESTEWTFDPSSLMTKEEKYILKADYIDPSGNVKSEWTKTKNIYLYDRPKALNADGNVLDGDFVNGEFVPNGKIVPPFFTYRYDATGRNDEFAAAGITVLRPEETITIEYLDDLHSKGMKALIQLYGDQPVGHPRRIQKTVDMVNLIKDHPAVLAYMLMDEPSKQVAPTNILTYEEMLYYLEEGYKLLRTLDDVHPIFVLESFGDVADGYERTSQMCDIFAIDPYPSSLENAISGSIAQKVELARNAVYDDRPIWMLGLAAAGWSGNYGNPENYGSAMLRYQLYDALWAGAKGAGHYVLSTDSTNDGTPYEDVYLDTFTEANSSGEIDEIYDHFLFGNSEVFGEGTGNGYQWRAWYKDNGDMFLTVRSKISNSGTALATASTNFKLVSQNGKISIDGFDATLINGTSEETVSSITNDFICNISAGEVSLYKVTPAENINFKNINEAKLDIIPLAYGADLITNGDCESAAPSRFTGYTSTTSFSRTSEKGAGGSSYSVKISPTGSSSAQLRAIGVPVDENSYYELSFSMYSDDITATTTPQVMLTYCNASGTSIKSVSLLLSQYYNDKGTWKDYSFILANPPYQDIANVDIKIIVPSSVSSTYFDNLSFRKVTGYNEELLISNTSFESFDSNSSYVNTNNSEIKGWAATTPANVYVGSDSHSGNSSIGIKNTSLYTTANIEGGKTYLFSAWFNASDLTSNSSYPSLKLQVGNFVSTTDFADAFSKKGSGWYKLSTEVTIPESVGTKATATVSLVMNGNDIGYFDDVSFKLKAKTGYTLRNLDVESTNSAVTVEYDVANHFTEDGGVVIYAFYNSDGSLITTESENAVFESPHVTKTFSKVDFTSMKVFIWNSLGGLIPYSNVLEQ